MNQLKSLTKFEKLFGIGILIVLLLLLFYSPIANRYAQLTLQEEYQNAYEQQKNKNLYHDSYSLPSDLTNAILPLYYELQKEYAEEDDVTPADILLTNQEDLTENEIDYFNEYIENIQLNFLNTYASIHYYLKDTETSATYTNKVSISSYLTSTADIDLTQTWYMAMHFNTSGTISSWNSSSTTFSATEVIYHIQSLSDIADSSSTIVNDYYDNYAYEDSDYGTIYELVDLKSLDIVFEVTKGSITEPYDSVNYVDEIISEHSYYFYPYMLDIIYLLFYLSFIIAFFTYRFIKHEERIQRFLHWSYLDAHIVITYVITALTIYPFIDACYNVLSISENSIVTNILTIMKSAVSFIFMGISFFLLCTLAWKIRRSIKYRSWKYWKEQLFCLILYHKIKQIIQIGITYLIQRIHIKMSRYIHIKIIIYIFLLSGYIIALYCYMEILVEALMYPYIAILITLLTNGITLYFILFFKERYKQKQIMKIKHLTENLVKENFSTEIPRNCGELEPIKEDLLKIHEQFETAIAEEVRSQQMKTELITNVSHDLKTPLTSIISYIDLLKNEQLTTEQRLQYLEILTTSSNRLKHLIQDLFDISKANSGDIHLEFMDVDIVALMKQVQLECDTMFKKRNLTIRNTFSDDKIIYSLDPHKTFRIFHNLLNNIAKYALENTRVYITIQDYQSFVEITMKNISEKEITYSPEELMERFVREDSARHSEGSGLGLSIVKSFTELQAGKVIISLDADLFKVTLRFQNTNYIANE